MWFGRGVLPRSPPLRDVRCRGDLPVVFMIMSGVSHGVSLYPLACENELTLSEQGLSWASRRYIAFQQKPSKF